MRLLTSLIGHGSSGSLGNVIWISVPSFMPFYCLNLCKFDCKVFEDIQLKLFEKFVEYLELWDFLIFYNKK